MAMEYLELYSPNQVPIVARTRDRVLQGLRLAVNQLLRHHCLHNKHVPPYQEAERPDSALESDLIDSLGYQ